jgi:hypothetical protein
MSSWKRNWVKLCFYGLFGFFWIIKVNQITSSQSLYGLNFFSTKKINNISIFFLRSRKINPACSRGNDLVPSVYCIIEKLRTRNNFLSLLMLEGSFVLPFEVDREISFINIIWCCYDYFCNLTLYFIVLDANCLLFKVSIVWKNGSGWVDGAIGLLELDSSDKHIIPGKLFLRSVETL